MPLWYAWRLYGRGPPAQDAHESVFTPQQSSLT